MIKIDYTAIKDQQLVDIRSQHDFQAGHLENALNLNPGNFSTYASDYLDLNRPIVFIVDFEGKEALEEIASSAEEKGFAQYDEYILIDEVPENELQNTPTISAEKFLDLSSDYILLDVRHPDEITRIAPKKNLVNIPLVDLADNYQSLDPNKMVYTLCGSGNRSTTAASYLESKGFKTSVIEGGMKAVQEENK